MPSLKSNYIRTDITSQCFRYQFQLLSNQPVDPRHYPQIEGYFLSLNPYVVFSYPFVYSVDQMKQLRSFNFMLSNGQKTQVAILANNTITLNSKQVSVEIHRQLMKGTKFLYSQDLNICLNPFEQRKVNPSSSLMPGFKISTETTNEVIGFYLIPIEAKITEFHSLSSLHQHSILLDYNSGTFYQKSAIVRYDKQNEVVFFRTGEQVKKEYLKALEIMPLSGFELAMRLTAYYKRLRESEGLKGFIEKWEVKFDSRFMELPYNFFPVSHILLGNKEEKSLGECLGSINSFNFQHNFRKLLSTSTFDQNMHTTIYLLIPQLHKPTTQQLQQSIDLQDPLIDLYTQVVQQEEAFMLSIAAEFQTMKQRMKLTECRVEVVRYDLFVGWVNGGERTVRQVKELVERENLAGYGEKVFVVSNTEELVREERESELAMYGSKRMSDEETNITTSNKPIIASLTTYFAQHGIYYHLINTKENDFRKYADIVAMKTLATIQTKLRLNPWRIKDIPFGTKPLMAVSLHVKQQPNGSVTVAVVGSLNAFLSKHTCIITASTPSQLLNTITHLITQCLQKFNSIHKIFPKRAMIFRTGDFTTSSSTQEQFKHIEHTLMETFACKATYILLTSQCPLRVYNQIDYNYISKDTVKSTQMLCQIRYNNQRYIQLQSDMPMYRVSVLGVDQQEVNFEEKVVELLTKLCFTYQLMTDMRYGKGLGFVGYAERLEGWGREVGAQGVKGMEANLREGVLVFL